MAKLIDELLHAGYSRSTAEFLIDCGVEDVNETGYIEDILNELECEQEDFAEYYANQDISPEQLAGEQFQDRLDLYRSEY